MTKPNLKTAEFKEIADWVYEAPEHTRTVNGIKLIAEKPEDSTRKIDVKVGNFDFWFASWYSDRNQQLIASGHPQAIEYKQYAEAMKLLVDTFGLKLSDEALDLPADTVEPMSETEKENLQLQAKLEVYQSLLPTPQSVTLNKGA